MLQVFANNHKIVENTIAMASASGDATGASKTLIKVAATISYTF